MSDLFWQGWTPAQIRAWQEQTLRERGHVCSIPGCESVANVRCGHAGVLLCSDHYRDYNRLIDEDHHEQR